MKENKLKIGIDIDNTITASLESMAFFSLITNALKDSAEIFIITNRDTSDESREETKEELDLLDIHYDELAITPDKTDYILKKGIKIFYDDTDEYYLNLPESVIVFKIRETGNFDFKKHKWIYGNKTGINMDAGK
jgi:hypothetical protein